MAHARLFFIYPLAVFETFNVGVVFCDELKLAITRVYLARGIWAVLDLMYYAWYYRKSYAHNSRRDGADASRHV
jgi:hypothetical protein